MRGNSHFHSSVHGPLNTGYGRNPLRCWKLIQSIQNLLENLAQVWVFELVLWLIIGKVPLLLCGAGCFGTAGKEVRMDSPDHG